MAINTPSLSSRAQKALMQQYSNSLETAFKRFFQVQNNDLVTASHRESTLV